MSTKRIVLILIILLVGFFIYLNDTLFISYIINRPRLRVIVDAYPAAKSENTFLLDVKYINTTSIPLTNIEIWVDVRPPIPATSIDNAKVNDRLSQGENQVFNAADVNSGKLEISKIRLVLDKEKKADVTVTVKSSQGVIGKSETITLETK